MAALVTLTDEQRNQLPRLINNLNFAVRNLDIGQLFVDVLDGTNTRVLETRDKWEIQFILNKLNLGTFHYEFGDLFVDLLEGTKADITANHKDDLIRVLNKLNMSLTALQFGEISGEAISPAAAAATQPGGGSTTQPGGGTTTPGGTTTNPGGTTTNPGGTTTPTLKTLKISKGTGVLGGTAAKPSIDVVAADPSVTLIVEVGTDVGAPLGTITATGGDATTATVTVDTDGKTLIIAGVKAGNTTYDIKSGSVTIPLKITVN